MGMLTLFGAAELVEAMNEDNESEAKVYIQENKRERCHSQIPKSREDAPQLREKGGNERVRVYRRARTSLYLRDGKAHSVWKPKRHTERKRVSRVDNEVVEQKQDLHERQQNLLSRVQATRDVLKEQKEELARQPEEHQSGMEVEEKEKEREDEEEEGDRESDQTHTSTTNGEQRWQHAIRSVMEENVGKKTRKDLKRMPWQFHDVVSQYVAAVSQPSPHSEAQPVVAQERQRAPTTPYMKSEQDRVISLRQWKSQYYESKKVKQERQERMKQFYTEPSIPKHLITIAEEDSEVPSPTATTVEIVMSSNSNQTDNPQPLPQPDTPLMDDHLDSPV